MLAHVLLATIGFMPLPAQPNLDPFVAAMLELKAEIDADALRDQPFGYGCSREWSDETWFAATGSAADSEEWRALYRRIDAVYEMPAAKRALRDGSVFPWPEGAKLLAARHIVNLLCIRSALAAHRGDANLAVDSLAEAFDYGRLFDDGTTFYISIEASLAAINLSALDLIEGEACFDPKLARVDLDPRLVRLLSHFNRSKHELRSAMCAEYLAAGIKPGRDESRLIDYGLAFFMGACHTTRDRVLQARSVLWLD